MSLLVPPNTQDVTDLLSSAFDKKKADATWTNSRYLNYLPTHTLDKAQQICIKAPANDCRTIYWTREMYLLMCVRICRGNRSDLANDMGVFPVNGCLSSCFESVEIFLNSTLITPVPTGYGFKCYFENTLGRSEAVRDHDLFTEGVISDTPHFMDDFTLTPEGAYKNRGLMARARYFAETGAGGNPTSILWEEGHGRGWFIGRFINDMDTFPAG